MGEQFVDFVGTTVGLFDSLGLTVAALLVGLALWRIEKGCLPSVAFVATGLTAIRSLCPF